MWWDTDDYRNAVAPKEKATALFLLKTGKALNCHQVQPHNTVFKRSVINLLRPGQENIRCSHISVKSDKLLFLKYCF